MLLLLFVSGNPAVAKPFGTEFTLVAVAVLLGLLMLFRGSRAREAPAMSVFFGFLVINLVHAVTFQFFPAITLAGWFVRLLIAYSAARLLRNFTATFVRIMYWLGLLSLFFWGLGLVGLGELLIRAVPPYSVRSMGNAAYTLLIHTYHTEGGPLLQRNCGFFWEPGAFAGYLLLAILMLSRVRDIMTSRQFARTLAVFLLCLASTLSTMGYVVLPVALLPVLRFDWTPSASTYLRLAFLSALIPFIVLGAKEVWDLEFMSDKIEWQYDTANYRGPKAYMSRFGAARFDWGYISQRPLCGWGMHSQTRFLLHPQFIGNPPNLGNGFTAFAAQFGLAGLLLFFGSVYAAARHRSPRSPSYPFVLCLVLFLTLQSENFLGYPLFLAMMFIAGTGNRTSRFANLPGH